jgi:hypothetical protein
MKSTPLTLESEPPARALRPNPPTQAFNSTAPTTFGSQAMNLVVGGLIEPLRKNNSGQN